MRNFALSCLCLLFVSPAQAQVAPRDHGAAPVAPIRPHTFTVHGETLRDDYFWLREKGTPQVDAYLRSERDYAEAYMKPTAALQEQLYKEMVSRLAEDDTTPPYREGTHLYWTRFEKGKQYPILCRRAIAAPAKEEVLLDLNALGAAEKFIALGDAVVSDDEQQLAYSTDVTGFHEFTLQVKDLRTGTLRSERIANVTSHAFSADGKTLFYVRDDAAKRPYRLYRHTLGSAAEKDALVYQEPDERFVLTISRTRSRKWLVLSSISHTQSEVRVLRSDRPGDSFRVVAERAPERLYELDHRGDQFYILVNDTGRNNRVVTAPVSAPQPANWKELIPHDEMIMREGIDLFSQFMVVREREGGRQQLRITDLRTGESGRVTFPEPVYAVFPAENAVFDTDVYRYQYQSPITPRSTFDCRMRQRDSSLVWRAPTPNYDPSRYRTERAIAVAKDGTQIPVSLLYSAGFQRDGSRPLLLDGYGSYGIPNLLLFDRSAFSLVDRGFVIAAAHVRGGGELGKKWHDAGRLSNKKNTFTDFIAAAEFLIHQRYTSQGRLAAHGGSAGGLLMGAVANMRPDLFKAILAYVPFVDVISTMLDETLPLTIGEFEEWGNPKTQADYLYMKSYSPYDNVVRQPYPAMLIVSSLNDSQVMYWEPAKWVAKLRANKTDKNPLLFRINLDPAGHGGKSGRYERLRDTAFDYAFLLSQMQGPK